MLIIIAKIILCLLVTGMLKILHFTKPKIQKRINTSHIVLLVNILMCQWVIWDRRKIGQIYWTWRYDVVVVFGNKWIYFFFLWTYGRYHPFYLHFSIIWLTLLLCVYGRKYQMIFFARGFAPWVTLKNPLEEIISQINLLSLNIKVHGVVIIWHKQHMPIVNSNN